jgi:hypothetical protein
MIPRVPQTLLSLIALLTLSSGCHQDQEQDTKMSESDNPSRQHESQIDSPNKTVLDEANVAGKWFRAKKSRPIWAKRLEVAQTVTTLEGDEKVEAGHYLCRGEAGDIWPQTEKDLNRRYSVTSETDADGWKKYQPNPDAKGVMAIQINHPFSVEATWGRLSGKPGDFLVKNFHDRETPYPVDIWIVDQTLFRQTYERVVMDQ